MPIAERYEAVGEIGSAPHEGSKELETKQRSEKDSLAAGRSCHVGCISIYRV
jgi:hypothetical protein